MALTPPCLHLLSAMLLPDPTKRIAMQVGFMMVIACDSVRECVREGAANRRPFANRQPPTAHRTSWSTPGSVPACRPPL